jgi:hypothetical protein
VARQWPAVRHVREYDALGQGKSSRGGSVRSGRAARDAQDAWKSATFVRRGGTCSTNLMMVSREGGRRASIVRHADRSRARSGSSRPRHANGGGSSRSRGCDQVRNLPRCASPSRHVERWTAARSSTWAGGAEKRSVKAGHASSCPPGRGAPIRAKGVRLDEEIEDGVAHLSAEAEPEFSDELARCAPPKRVRSRARPDGGHGRGRERRKRDEVYECGVSRRAHRRQGLGLAPQRKSRSVTVAAARIMDMMAKRTRCGPPRLEAAGEVLPNLERWLSPARKGRSQSQAA